jgi:tetratricopeptide (TPR) repeat protein
MPLEDDLASPTAWDALSAEPSLELLTRLQALPASPLREARLAYVQLMLGHLEEADATLGSLAHPLAEALRLAIWVERHQFSQVARAAIPEEHPEARARVLLERSKALFHLARHTEAARLARQALAEAKGARMSRFAEVCALHAEECRRSLEEPGGEDFDPVRLEGDLREAVTHAPSQEARVMAYMCLVRLIARQGLYDRALRFTLEVPKPLNGQHFVELMLVLNRLDDESDWYRLQPRYRGRLHAIKGLLRLDADLVLAGDPPDPSFHPRPHAEWSLAFGWACLSKGRYEEALAHFQAAFIPRCEWDLRFVRGMGLLELLVLAPHLLPEYNPPALVGEVRWLATRRIHPESLIFRLIPWAMPYATALLLAGPGGCPPLERHAAAHLLLASPKGLSIAGVTHPNTTALVRLIEGDTAQMSPGALRTNRHRLKLYLQQFGNPQVVRASRVLEALERLSGQPEGADWAASAHAYQLEHGL